MTGTASLPGAVFSLTARELYDRMKAGERPWLVDVRSADAFSAWHLPTSEHCPADQIASIVNLRTTEKPILICNRGMASVEAARTLATLGRQSIALSDGLKGWNRLYEIRPIATHSPSGLRVFQIIRLGKGCLSYLVVDSHGNSLLVDPGHHREAIDQLISDSNSKLVALVDTHLHADHLSGGEALAARAHVPYFLPAGSATTQSFQPLDAAHPALAPFRIQIIATPGHTIESISLVIDNTFLVVGDLLFATTVGRSDLAQDVADNARILYDSVINRVFGLPDNLIVLSAHLAGPTLPGSAAATFTLGETKQQNEILQFQLAEQYASFVAASTGPTPPNFETIKQINRGLLPPVADPDELELGGNKCAVPLRHSAGSLS